MYPASLKQLRMGCHHCKLFKGMDSCLLPNAASICLLVKQPLEKTSFSLSSRISRCYSVALLLSIISCYSVVMGILQLSFSTVLPANLSSRTLNPFFRLLNTLGKIFSSACMTRDILSQLITSGTPALWKISFDGKCI